MRHLRRTFLSAFAVALCAAPVASAHPPDHDGRAAVVTPARGAGLTGGELLGEAWVQTLMLHEADHPPTGRCLTLAPNVIAGVGGDAGAPTCTITQRTRLLVFNGSFCSNVEAPAFPQTPADQRACAVEFDKGFQEINISVDGAEPINIVRRRFEVVSPQRRVLLPGDNFFGLPAGPATFVAHAYAAVVHGLRPGQHTVTVEVVNPDFGDPFTVTAAVLDVTRGQHPIAQ
jgi:hypothetical protein